MLNRGFPRSLEEVGIYDFLDKIELDYGFHFNCQIMQEPNTEDYYIVIYNDEKTIVFRSLIDPKIPYKEPFYLFMKSKGFLTKAEKEKKDNFKSRLKKINNLKSKKRSRKLGK